MLTPAAAAIPAAMPPTTESDISSMLPTTTNSAKTTAGGGDEDDDRIDGTRGIGSRASTSSGRYAFAIDGSRSASPYAPAAVRRLRSRADPTMRTRQPQALLPLLVLLPPVGSCWPPS